VEDEPDVRAVAARILKNGGFRVIEAHNGVRALELVDRHGPPDLVLSDVVMPAMDGPELERRLRARWPALPILFMSGYSVEELRQRGSFGYEKITIPKPFTPGGLLWSVTEALAQERSKGAVRP
jgi:two-component system cell cycle sensor histidine kinase/response regulator CckA